MSLNSSIAAKLQHALERSDVLVALFDDRDLVQYANAAYRDTYLRGLAMPVAFADILRHGFSEGFGVKVDCGDVEQFLAEILPRRRAKPSRSVLTDTVDGRWILFTETMLAGDWLLTVATDITVMKQHERHITQLHASALHASLTDALTGVSNRRHIMELAQAAVNAFEQDRTPVTIVVLDIDHFKSVNDTHGHLVGDRVLVEFCAKCKAHLRPTDSLGRLGGEEFLLVLHGVRTGVAASVMERLKESVRDGATVPYTFSGGIAHPLPGENLEMLLRRADAALYLAKQSGRDRCVISPGNHADTSTWREL
jgi:diguanylate cyclase (GGDEF)-like protein